MEPHRLVLVRHAQAAGGAVDADRPLTAGGARHAATIGGWLGRAGLLPDRVVVSPARRAVQTWAQAGGRLPGAPGPVVEPRVYDNTVEALLAAVRETPDDVRTLLLVGHNPSIGELAAVLDDGEGTPADRRDADDGFPTGAVAVFTLAAPFAAVGPGAGRLDRFAVPGD